MTEPEQAPEPIDDVLRSDHAAILDAVAALRTNTDTAAVGDLFSALCADVVRHFVAEEQYLLPAVREHLDGGEQISKESFAEHERIEGLLKKVDDVDTTDDHITSMVTEVESALREHVAAQQQHVLPALVAALDVGERNRLGEGMLGAEQLAPTHPRSIVVKSAALSKLTSWIAGLVEKGLDSR